MTNRYFRYVKGFHFFFKGIAKRGREIVISVTFDISSYIWYDGCKEGEFLRLGRMDVNQLVELAVQYDNYDWTLPPVLEFYIQLLNRYNHEDAYITV